MPTTAKSYSSVFGVGGAGGASGDGYDFEVQTDYRKKRGGRWVP